MLRVAAYHPARVQASGFCHLPQRRQAFGIIMIADMSACLLQLVRRDVGPGFPHEFQIAVQVAFAILAFFPYDIHQYQPSMFGQPGSSCAKKTLFFVT